MKTFEIKINIDSTDPDTAVMEIYNLFSQVSKSEHAGNPDRIWRYIKERVNHMSIEDTTDPFQDPDEDYPTSVFEVDSLEERS